jgi:putative salt-induced outer membrane protein
VSRKLELLTLIAFFGLSSAVFADQITLKNGDHLTGTVVKSDGKTLVLHTEAAGDVTLQFSAITQIKTDKDLHVGTTDKKMVVGPVTESDGKIEVATKTGGTVEVPATNVALIRDDAEEAAYEQSLHPSWKQAWAGGVNVGFSVARGNSEVTNLGLGINAVRQTLNDKTIVSLTSVNTNNQLATPSTVASLVTAGLEYDHNLTARVFGFGSAGFTSNALQNLDLRAVYTGGLGYHLVKSAVTTLDLEAGLNYTHETYSDGAQVTPPTVPPTFVSDGVTNRFAALTLGEELGYKAGKTTVITEKSYIYPDLSDTSQYRFTFDLATVTKMSKWLGWQNEFSDIYVTNPPLLAKRNDLILTTGLNFSFTH